jgi:site-specific recombinase XerC
MDVLEPAAGGPAPRLSHASPNLLRQQISQQEWAYLESLPARSLSEEIKLMRVLSLRLVQQGLLAENPGDEIRYYSEATRIMARLPQLLKAEQALQAGQDDVTQAMIQAIKAVLEGDEKKKARQLELPLEGNG